MTKVLRLAWEYPSKEGVRYGLGPTFHNLSVAQAKMGYSVHVIATRGRGEPKEEESEGVIVHRVRPPHSIGSLRLLPELAPGTEECIVHAHATCGVLYPIMRPLIGAPIVTHIHGTSHTHYTPVSLRFGETESRDRFSDLILSTFREKFLWERSDALVYVSEAIEKDVLDFYGVKPSISRVVKNGVDTEIFRPKHNETMPPGLEGLAGRDIILFVGHFGYRKGLYYLLRAVEELKDLYPNAHLVCVGGTPSWLGSSRYWEVIRRWIGENDLQGRVTLLNSVPHVLLPAYYNSARLFVLPSYYESFAKVVLEAMACSLPVIATDRGGLKEVVLEGTTGFLVPFGDSNALAMQISRLLSDERLSRKLGAYGRMRAEEEYTWAKVAERISVLYEFVLDSKNGHRSRR